MKSSEKFREEIYFDGTAITHRHLLFVKGHKTKKLRTIGFILSNALYFIILYVYV